MSSSDASKRRRVVDDSSDRAAVTSATEDIMADMKAHMMGMQNKMNELETRNISMQNEMDGVKNQLLQIDDLKEENKDLKTRCSSLEARCESLQASVNILIKDQKWEYSAPVIPTSYWEERGYEDDYIDGAEYFLQQIEMCTTYLRSGDINWLGDHIHLRSIEIWPDDLDQTEILHHDDRLLPHWKEFATALRLYQNPDAKWFGFSVENVQLPPLVLNLLTPAVKEKHITSFYIGFNELVNVREGIEFVVHVMQTNKQLKSITWEGNEIESVEDAQYLTTAICSHPTIDDVRLYDCLGEGNVNGYDILRTIITSGKRFTHIDLSNNSIRTDGGTEIPDYLATNPPLNQLRLSNNKLHDDDAILIAGALKRNTKLKRIELGKNNITEVGGYSLSKAIYDPSSLNALSDCNHVCHVFGIDLGNLTELAVLRDGANYKRAAKIYRLLSSRNEEGSNVYHLNMEFGGDDDENGDSLKLVPKVLDSVQRYSKSLRTNQGSPYKKPLSIIYEIMRSWRMPELYEQMNSGGS